MTDSKPPSDKSAAFARQDGEALHNALDAARALGAIPTDDNAPAAASSLVASDDTFDPALDLPLGIEPVGSMPREIVMRETDPPQDVLPKGIVVQAAVREMTRAAAELGYPTHGTGYWITAARKGREPAHFRDRHSNPQSGIPPFIDVDLTGGDARPKIASSLVRAVMQAARAPRHPERILAGFVDKERADRWPEIRDRGRQTTGLRKRLKAAADQATSEHMGRWFCEMALPVHLEAYDSGVPVDISGTASTGSGFQVTWRIGPDSYGSPAINLTASAYKLDETIRHVIDLILFAHAVDSNSEQGQHLARHMWAAAVARLTAVPEAPPF